MSIRFWVFVLVLTVCAIVFFSGQGALLLAGNPPPEGLSDAFGLAFLQRYLIVPIVSVAGAMLILAPGLSLALASMGDEVERPSLSSLVFRGHAISLLALSALAAVIGILDERPLVGGAYLGVLLAALLGALLALARADRAGRVNWAVFSDNRAAILIALGIAVLMIGLMAPKFLWEDLNGDGADLFISTHSLIEIGWPIRPLGGEMPMLYPGEILAEIFNAAQFVRLFGESAFAVRMPMVLGFSLLFVAVIGMIGRGRERPSLPMALAVGAVMLLIAWVLAYQASYNPYFADIALPGGREPFVSFWLLGMIWFLLEGRLGWVVLMGALLGITVPSAPVLIGLWSLAALLFCRRGAIWSMRAFAALALGLIAGAVLPKLLPDLAQIAGIGAQSREFAAGSIARRLRFIALGEYGRLLFWVIPGGILPALALLMWPWQDRLSRALSVMTLAYAAFFQIQAYRVLPHHFSPAMVLPLIVYGRLRMPFLSPGRAAAALVLSAALAAFLSRPPDARPHMDTRHLAERIHLDPALDMPENGWEAYARLNMMAALLRDAFPPSYENGANAGKYVVSPISIVLMEYLERKPAQGPRRLPPPDFEIRPDDGKSIFDTPMKLARKDGFALLARSRSVYQSALNHRVSVHSLGNRIYQVPRREIFGGAGADEGVLDLARLIGLRRQPAAALPGQ